jgi:hypothetical protein
VEALSPEERASHNYALRHLPSSESDPVLLVLKGHLLIEEKVLEFVLERMLAPDELDDARLSSYQAICLAQALTLPNEEPAHLWTACKRINALRNRIVHNLTVEDVEKQLKEIVLQYSEVWPVKAGFAGVVSHLYGQLAELCRMARDPAFRVKGRE